MIHELRQSNYPKFPLNFTKVDLLSKLNEFNSIDNKWIMYTLLPNYLMQPWLASALGKSFDDLAYYITSTNLNFFCLIQGILLFYRHKNKRRFAQEYCIIR